MVFPDVPAQNAEAVTVMTWAVEPIQEEIGLVVESAEGVPG